MTAERVIVLKANDWFLFTYLSDKEKASVFEALLDDLNGRHRRDLTEIENVAFWAIVNAQEDRHG